MNTPEILSPEAHRRAFSDVVRDQGADSLKCGLPAANDGDLTEEDLAAIDASFAQRKAADCADMGQRRARLAQSAELHRMPNGGYLHG